MDKKIYKVDTVTDDLIDLYTDCFSEDIIYVKRDRAVIENRVLIEKMFNYFISYGTILAMNHYNKPIAFLAALSIGKVKKDNEACKLFFCKEKYPEVNEFISRQKEGKYIVLVAVNRSFRNRLLATKLVKHYMRYYSRNEMTFADIDNKYSLKLFENLGFEITQFKLNYYLAVRNK